MSRSKLMTAIAVFAIVGLATPVLAQRHGGGRSAGQGHSVSRPGGAAAGHAVPRGSVPVRPPVTGPYRSYGHYPYYYYYYYYYPYYRGFGLGFNYGYPGYFGYPFGYLGYGYSGYGYPAYGYGYGGYGYGYGAYGYEYPGSITAAPDQAFGRLRIQDAPSAAQVFADGYYVGVVDDFDGARQYLNLEVGTHRIEILATGFETLTFDVNVQPSHTITYRAQLRPLQP